MAAGWAAVVRDEFHGARDAGRRDGGSDGERADARAGCGPGGAEREVLGGESAAGGGDECVHAGGDGRGGQLERAEPDGGPKRCGTDD